MDKRPPRGRGLEWVHFVTRLRRHGGNTLLRHLYHHAHALPAQLLQSSASPAPLPRTRSNAPIASSHVNTTPTSIRQPTPPRSSQRSSRPTTCLSDDAKHKEYDQFGFAPRNSARPGPSGNPHYTWSDAGGHDIDGEDVESVFDAIFGGRAGFGNQTRGRELAGLALAHTARRARATPPQCPCPPFMTMAKGGSESLRIREDGNSADSIEVTIPPGIANSGRLRRMHGSGSKSGNAPDLIITIKVDPHPPLPPR